MKCVYFIYAIIFVAGYTIAEASGKQFRCDYKYFDTVDGWLKLHEVPATWYEARLRCNLEGANLASPLNLGLKTSMLSMMYEERTVNYSGIFTGIHATFSQGDLFSVEGVPFSKIPKTWAEDEPDNCNNEENCILMTSNGQMADVNCSDTFPFMCYKKFSKKLILNGCGTTDPEYIMDPRTGSCYKFHSTARTWSRAYMACAAEGGFLAIINSDTESQVIKSVYARNPPESIQGNFYKNAAHVGFSDWNVRGKFLTIEGQTLQEAGFAKFEQGQPDNMFTREFCGSVFRSGLLNDVDCNMSLVSICEMTPGSLLCNDDQ